MKTIIDEILHESQSEGSCHGGQCGCSNCRHQQENEIQQMQQELEQFELDLEREEEEELSRIFARAKQLLKKGYNKARPYLVAFKIANTIIPGQPPPTEIVNKDTAALIEQDKKRQRDEWEEQARQTQEARRKMARQKPDQESSVMHELLTELEYGG